MSQQEIQCLLWNAGSLQNKLDDFIAQLEDGDIDVAAVTETWFTSQQNSNTAVIKNKGYSITHFNRDPDERKGGGVAIIYRNNFKVNSTKTYKFDSFECALVSLTCSFSQQFTFIVVYRYCELAPAQFLTEFYDFIDSIFINFKNLLILGDFNLHVNERFTPSILKFYDVLSSFALSQLVEGPTHKLGNTLDLIVTNPGEVEIKNVRIDFENKSDHAYIFFNVPLDIKQHAKKTIEITDFKNVNIDQFKVDILARAEGYMENVVGNATFSDALKDYNVLCDMCVREHVQTKTVNVRGFTRPKWIDSEFLKSRAERRRLYKRWIRTKNDSDRYNFKTARIKTQNLSIEKQSKYLATTIENCKNSHKELFNVSKNLLDNPKSKTLPAYDDPVAMATKFNNYFIEKIDNIRSSFGDETGQTYGTGRDTYNGVTISEFQIITAEEVRKLILSKPIKTSKQDPMPANLIKHCVNELLPVLTHLVNLSLSTGSMDGLKDSVISPILKKAGLDPDVLKNYRPVCNAWFLSKITERAALVQANKHMDEIVAHVKNQSGYKINHSCETLLLRISNDILINLDCSKCTIMLLLDLSAAFDTVDHVILLDILWFELGFRGTVFRWFVEFLGGRRQAVDIDGHQSNFRENKYGVPQGSVVGPFLFNIYVRNLIKMLEKKGFTIHGYADDHQILFSFQIDFQVSAVRSTVPLCLDLIAGWMKKHFLKLNPTKSQVIVFHPHCNNKVAFDQLMLSDGSYTKISSQVYNLGVIFDSSMTFSPFISSSISQGYQLLRNIAGIRKYLSNDHIKTLVNSIVVAKVDNCNSLLYGISGYDLDKLRKFQNSCARLIYGRRKRDHVTAILRELHWLPSEARIYFKMLCYVFKCLQGLAPAYLSELLAIRRDHDLSLIVPRMRSKYGDRAFACAGPRLWNALPVDIRLLDSLDTFKSRVKHLLFSSFTQYKHKVNMYKS